MINTIVIKIVTISCRFARGFAENLLGNILTRFPDVGASNQLSRFGNYLDPSWKGAHLDALNYLQVGLGGNCKLTLIGQEVQLSSSCPIRMLHPKNIEALIG